MRILEVGRYKKEYVDNILPFIKEQGESLRQAGCEVDYFRVRGNYVLAVRELRAKIEEFRPDIVHAHYGLSAITAELQNMVPVVTTFHNGETANWYVNLMTSLMSLRAKHCIYVAEHIREKLYFVNKHNTILPCGISLEDCKVTPYEEARKLLGYDSETKYILFGGAFSNTRKNVTLLREAVKLLQIADCRLQIKIVEMKGLSRAECVLRMCACDAFALPSKSEGSPQALKEAMACGCPCVATDIADCRYLLNGVTNSYVTGFDAKEIAGVLNKIFEIGERTNGREKIIKMGYTNELVAQKLIEIYKSVMRQG